MGKMKALIYKPKLEKKFPKTFQILFQIFPVFLSCSPTQPILPLKMKSLLYKPKLKKRERKKFNVNIALNYLTLNISRIMPKNVFYIKNSFEMACSAAFVAKVLKIEAM